MSYFYSYPGILTKGPAYNCTCTHDNQNGGLHQKEALLSSRQSQSELNVRAEQTRRQLPDRLNCNQSHQCLDRTDEMQMMPNGGRRMSEVPYNTRPSLMGANDDHHERVRRSNSVKSSESYFLFYAYVCLLKVLCNGLLYLFWVTALPRL